MDRAALRTVGDAREEVARRAFPVGGRRGPRTNPGSLRFAHLVVGEVFLRFTSVGQTLHCRESFQVKLL